MKKITKMCIAAAMMLCLLLSLTACGGDSDSGSKDGDTKNITIVVTHKDGTVNEQTSDTTAKNLIDALTEMELVDPDNGDDGYYTTVDGETADTTKEEWWCLTIDGESAITGFDDTPVEGGKSYELTFTVGW